MGKAWQKISGFFSGGRSARGPRESDLYSGPGASWDASYGADGTISAPTRAPTPFVAPARPAALDQAARFVDPQKRARMEADWNAQVEKARQAHEAQQSQQNAVPLAAQARGSQTGTQAAMQALANTQRIANTGWTAQDRQAFGAADRASQRSAQAAIGALAQQARARGVQNSGAQFAAAAGTAQSASNAAADRGAQIAQMGAERRAQASQALGQMGMGIDAQTFGQNMARGSAVDQFNRWSTATSADAKQQAYENERQYQADEEARRQRIMDRMSQMYQMGSGAFGGGIGGGS
jgi:hypothetical protein